MNLTLYFGVNNTVPLDLDVGFDKLCEILQFAALKPWHRSNKLDAPALTLGRCAGHRCIANMRFHCGLAADFDTAPNDPRYVSFDDMCDRLERDDYAFAAYTTTKNDSPHNKFRVLFPYARDVALPLCRPAWHACNAKFNGTMDKSTKNEDRLSFLPADWIGNPFTVARRVKREVGGRIVSTLETTTVTLDDPFSAIRVKTTGRPILSDAEINALRPEQGATPPEGEKGFAATPAALTAAERQTMAQRGPISAPAWMLLTDLKRSPLVRPWMRDELPHDPGNRDHRFMTAVAKKAVTTGLPITTDVIVTLAEQFSRECLHREPPHDAERQADNALAWAFRNFGAHVSEPSQPEVGT